MYHTMKTIIFYLCLLISPFVSAEDWGKTGHRVVGEIAAQHLTKKTQRAIKKLLEGKSLAYVSTYADEVKSDANYKKYSPWHYVNLPLDKEYKDVVPPEQGDIVQALNFCIAQLQKKQLSRADKIFALTFLIHLVGDAHQPLHVGKKEDRGGNRHDVKWFGKNSNLHRVWDSEMINSYGMSYSELANNLVPIFASINPALSEQLNPLVWIQESQNAVRTIYANTPQNSQLGYDYSYQYFPLVQKRLYLAGIRLAALLNQIFDA